MRLEIPPRGTTKTQSSAATKTGTVSRRIKAERGIFSLRMRVSVGNLQYVHSWDFRGTRGCKKMETLERLLRSELLNTLLVDLSGGQVRTSRPLLTSWFDLISFLFSKLWDGSSVFASLKSASLETYVECEVERGESPSGGSRAAFLKQILFP